MVVGQGSYKQKTLSVTQNMVVLWSLVRVVVRQGFYCIAVRLTKWCISQTAAMLFAPVHGGCYIISSVGIEYSCGLSVM